MSILTPKPDWSWLEPRNEGYYSRQFETPYRSTIHLADFTRRVLGSDRSAKRVIDVGCGAGAVMYHLNNILPDALWVGLDLAFRHLSTGKPRLNNGGRYSLVQGDFYRLTSTFGSQSFDHSFSVQTLSWCPGYEPIVSQILAMTKGWSFFTALFTDFPVDAMIKLTDYSTDIEGVGPLDYNVYSLRRFTEFCREQGAAEVIAEDFLIDVDLDPPATGGIGTYTRRLDDGSRLQFSGPIVLPWKAIAIRNS